MAEIDYIIFSDGQAYLDKILLDNCFYRLGANLSIDYEDFIIRNPEGDHVNLVALSRCFAVCRHEKEENNKYFYAMRAKHRTDSRYYWDIDRNMGAYRFSDNRIVSYRLVHYSGDCSHNKGADRFFFANDEEKMNFFTDNIPTMALTPCPYCLPEIDTGQAAPVRFSCENGRVSPSSKFYPLNVSWMNVPKERAKQARRRASEVRDWGGLMNILCAFVMTLILCVLFLTTGLKEKLLEIQTGYFAFATGFFPTLFTDIKNILHYKDVGVELLTSTDKEMAVQGAAWLALALSSALMMGLHSFYDQWEDERWKTFFLKYPLMLLRAAVITLVAIPLPMISIPYLIGKNACRAGKKLAALACPWSVCTQYARDHFYLETHKRHA